MNDTLLIIMNPREIPECMTALRSLRGVDKAWCSYYTETELETVIPQIIDQTEYRRYTIISDDTVPTQDALDAVLDLHDQYPDGAACGWVNVDAVSNLSTMNLMPLRGSGPTVDAYSFISVDAARKYIDPVRTYFHGFVFATMSRELAIRYPFRTYNGCASDLHQCHRLQADDVPICTLAAGEVFHVKERANVLDQAPEKRLLIGEREACVTMEIDA